MTTLKRFCIVLWAALAAASLRGQNDRPLQYPQTRRVEQADLYHGTKVEDPYRWLEQDVRTSKEVADWVAAQNKVTSAHLESIPEREAMRRRLTDLWNYERYSPPSKVAGRYVFSKNDGLQNQSVIYIQDSLASPPQVLIDPNQWSKDGTVALAGAAFSEDGRHIAYGVAEAGSDWVTWHVMRVDSRKVLDDEIRWSKFGGASWTRDGRGFFYGRFPEPKPGEKYQTLNLNQQVYYHRTGTSQADDVLVYQRPDQPSWTFGASVTEDGRYLILSISNGTTSPNRRIAYRDLEEPYGMPVDLIGDFDNMFEFLGNNGPVFYFTTDLQAPLRRVLAIDIRKPERSNWREVIPQAADSLSRVSMTGNFLVASYLQDAKTQVRIFAPDGKFIRDVPLAGIGSASGFGGRQTDTETFYTFSSFATPPSIFRYDLITGQSALWRRAAANFDPDDYETKQVFYTSKDGTRVPMFISHRKGLRLDGSNPTLLTGYGGFNIPQVPGFSVSRLAWMEMGGVLAVACIRGGGEYGRDWWRAGTHLKKQNVFDDFIAGAEWLIANKYTSTPKLAIQGASNGGLLVGAAMTQRPDLFGACLPAVGVMDMLRFHKFTAGRFWVDDYGSSDNAEQFKALLAYSPYHNIKPGTRYPATLVTTADTDDRVVPGHSFKFLSALQHAQAGPAPVLGRIETRAGHGGGKPTTKQIDEVTDQWAFLVRSLGMKLTSR